MVARGTAAPVESVTRPYTTPVWAASTAGTRLASRTSESRVRRTVPPGEGSNGCGSSILQAALPQCRLGGRESRDGYAERRARHIGHAGGMAERHARRLAAVLAADANLEILARPAPQLD